MDKESNIRVLDRALDILECFSEEMPEMTLKDMTEKSGLSNSTVHRILKALEQREYLIRDEDTKRYYLGPRIGYLANLIARDPDEDLKNKARDCLIRLRDEFDESASLYIREGKYRICIERMESGQALRTVIKTGERMAISQGGTGKVLLSGLDEQELCEMLGVQQYEGLTKDIERVRKQGYWVSNGEREKGLSSIAAPVYNAKGTIVAAISLSGPSERIIDEELAEKVRVVVQQGKQLSRKLGYYKEASDAVL